MSFFLHSGQCRDTSSGPAWRTRAAMCKPAVHVRLRTNFQRLGWQTHSVLRKGRPCEISNKPSYSMMLLGQSWNVLYTFRISSSATYTMLASGHPPSGPSGTGFRALLPSWPMAALSSSAGCLSEDHTFVSFWINLTNIWCCKFLIKFIGLYLNIFLTKLLTNVGAAPVA